MKPVLHTCPQCHHEFESGEVLARVSLPPPIYPMYDLRVAAELIPTTYAGLVQFLQRNKQEYAPRYRIYEDGKGIRRRVRILSSREILAIRVRTLRGEGKATQ